MTRKPISRRVETMPRSAIRTIMTLAAERKNVIHLEAGEPDFFTPPHIVEGAYAALKEGWTKYTANAGIAPLRALIAARSSARAGKPVEAERVVVTVGAVGALFTAVVMVCEAGDELLIPDPGWPNYVSIPHIIGVKPVRFRMPAARGFLPDLADIEAKITPKTKAILINTPGNPTGVVFPADVMKGIVDIARRHGIYVISDEIYEDLVFNGEHVSAARFSLDEQVFIVSGVSKSYSMTGWRLGYLVCPPGLAQYAAAIQEPIVSNAPAVSQKAAEAALGGPQDCVAEAAATFQRRRDILLEVLGNTGLLMAEPDGSFYALVSIGGHFTDSMEFAKALITEREVATVPGVTFGEESARAVRVAFTTRDDRLRTGLERLRDFVQKG